MGRRCLMLLGVLLLCINTAACKRNETGNETENVFLIHNGDMQTEKNNIYGAEVMDDKKDNITDGVADMDLNNNSKNNGNDNVYNVTDNNTDNDIKAFVGMEEVNPKEDLINKYKGLSAGTTVNTVELGAEVLDSLFFFQELDQSIINRITGKSYKEDCDVPYSDLRYVKVLHTDFEGQTRIGELIVNKAIAQDVVDIFKELYSISYPIEKIILIDEYDADDNKSMADNNTSAFNFRYVDGTTRRSVHSDGLAIDINPLYNPYVRTRNNKQEILPENGVEYADRTKDNIYYIRKDDPCYKAFTSRGFTWGGEWKNSKDYQHFEKK